MAVDDCHPSADCGLTTPVFWCGSEATQFNKPIQNDQQEKGMSPVLLLHRYAARKSSTAVSGFMKLELQRKVPERRERAVNLRCSEMLVLLAISTLAFLANGAMAQAQEVSMPIFSTGRHDATPLETQAIEKFSQHPASQTLRDAAKLSPIKPIKPIDTGSDIRSFLAPGLPADLTRAA